MLYLPLGLKGTSATHRRLPAIFVAISTQYLNQRVLESLSMTTALPGTELCKLRCQVHHLLLLQPQCGLGTMKPCRVQRFFLCLATNIGRSDLNTNRGHFVLNCSQPIATALHRAGQSHRHVRRGMLIHGSCPLRLALPGQTVSCRTCRRCSGNSLSSDRRRWSRCRSRCARHRTACTTPRQITNGI